MNAPTVESALNSTMLTAPMIAATPNTRPALIRGWPPPLSVGWRISLEMPFSLSHTPMPSSTAYSTPTATSHTKNRATPRTSDSLSTDHGSNRLICKFARRGPRPGRRSALGVAAAPTRSGLVDGPGPDPSRFTVVRDGVAPPCGMPAPGAGATVGRPSPNRRAAAAPVTTGRSIDTVFSPLGGGLLGPPSPSGVLGGATGVVIWLCGVVCGVAGGGAGVDGVAG